MGFPKCFFTIENGMMFLVDHLVLTKILYSLAKACRENLIFV